MKNVEKEVDSIFRQVMRISDTTALANIHQSNFPAWDSLRHVELIIKLRNHFGITITTPEVIQMNSLSSIINLIKSKIPSD